MDKGNSSKMPSGKRNINIKPENIKAQLRQTQNKYVNTILENEITFCQGPAGTSKTFTACYTALKLLANKEISQIVLCKPIQESGEKLGFLPGDIKEKTDPYMQSYVSNLKKIIGNQVTEALVENEIILLSLLLS